MAAEMKLPRRKFLHFAVGAAALPAVSRFAWAQAYPTRPVRCIVGYAAGGGTDIFVRLMGQSLSERLGVDAAAAINATLYDNLNFNFARDIAVVGIIRGPLVMMVHPSVPAKTV